MIFEFIKSNLKNLSSSETEVIKEILNRNSYKLSKEHEALTEDELDFLQQVLKKTYRD